LDFCSVLYFFFSSRRRHTRSTRDWSSDVCSSDLAIGAKLDPHYKYYTSRWMGEQELAKTGVAGTILRFSFILAEEGGILNDFERSEERRVGKEGRSRGSRYS